MGKEEIGQVISTTSAPPSGRRDKDVAARFLEELDPAIMHAPITKKEARKLLWKIDVIVVVSH